jgi:ribosomal protein L37AE/L43A
LFPGILRPTCLRFSAFQGFPAPRPAPGLRGPYNEKAAIDWFIDMRYKGNLVCPHCGTSISIYRERKRLKVFHCSHCNNFFSPIKDTIFEKTHIDIRSGLKQVETF